MGLNFRKSIKLLPGVKLNLSKGGVSLSGGVRGLRASINTKGQVTGTASIPGTGVYYTKKKTLPIGKNKKDKTAKEEKEKKTAKKTSAKKAETKPAKAEEAAAEEEAYTPKPTFQQAAAAQPKQPLYQPKPVAAQVDMEAVRAIHKVADDTIDWSEIMASPTAPAGYDQQMWSYYYEAAPKVLDGDIDTYLQLIDAQTGGGVRRQSGRARRSEAHDAAQQVQRSAAGLYLQHGDPHRARYVRAPAGQRRGGSRRFGQQHRAFRRF